MADSSTPPELVEAYRLIKAGQRPEAGKILKAYLAQNGRDAKAWWLMAHAVDKPDGVRRCLETVLKLDPGHAKAREKLARLAAPPAAPTPGAVPVAPGETLAPAVPPFTAPPAPAPAAAASTSIDEPDDSFFGVSSAIPVGRSSRPAPVPAPAAGGADPVQETASAPPSPFDLPSTPPAAPVGRASRPAPTPQPAAAEARSAQGTAPPSSFEEYVTNSARFEDPFAAPVPGDPFADVPPHGTPGGGAAAIPKPPKPAAWGTGDGFAATQTRHGLDRAIGVVVVVFALLVAVGLILFIADRQGMIHLSQGDRVPKLTALDGGTFEIDYPQGWDRRCLSDVSGYPVCGVANHPLFNEVEYYAGTVNLGQYISEGLSAVLTGSDLPDEQVSIIVMDVPRSSPSYDDSSLAKSLYEWDQEFTFGFDDAETRYDRQEITVDGLKAYYYEYTSEGNMKEAAWDVYVEHDGIILWLRVSFWGPRRSDIPYNLVEKMIQSIDLKPA